MTLKTKKIIAREFFALLLAAVLTLLSSPILDNRNNYYEGVVKSQTSELLKIERLSGRKYQHIEVAYDLFKQNGYEDSIDDFKVLVSSNPDALNMSYDLFKKDGYKYTIDDFEKLMGLGLSDGDQDFKKMNEINASILNAKSKTNGAWYLDEKKNKY